jgi:hypothetical protein
MILVMFVGLWTINSFAATYWAVFRLIKAAPPTDAPSCGGLREHLCIPDHRRKGTHNSEVVLLFTEA